MIQITKGTFGWFDGRRIIPLSAATGPVRLDPGLERRLVEKDRIAIYVDDPVIDADFTETDITDLPEAKAIPPEELGPEITLEEGDSVPDLNEMTFKELGEELGAYGEDPEVIKKLKSKASRIARIQAIHDKTSEEYAKTQEGSFLPEGM